MKSYISFLSLFLVSSLFSQESKDYLIKLNQDTLFLKVIKLDRQYKKVMCELKGRKLSYPAKDLLEIKKDSITYETALLRLKNLGSKKYVFLQRIIKGKLSLFEIPIKRTHFDSKTFAADFIHLRWVYRAHDWFKSETDTVYFYKKENETREAFSKNRKEKIADCKVLMDKLAIENRNTSLSAKELVCFYNTQCR